MVGKTDIYQSKIMSICYKHNFKHSSVYSWVQNGGCQSKHISMHSSGTTLILKPSNFFSDEWSSNLFHIIYLLFLLHCIRKFVSPLI